MKQSFRAACIQMTSILGKQDLNLTKAESLILEAVKKDAKLILLPECFDHGYDLKNFNNKNYYTEKTSNMLSQISKKHSVVLIAGYPTREEDKTFNTCGVYLPNGTIHKYHKCHLIPLLGETEVFEAGSRQILVKSELANICPMICYDLRFPEFSRQARLAGAEIFLFSSAWPKARIEAWKTLLKARAIENQVYVLGANQVGEIQGYDFHGNSMIVDPLGDVIASASASNEEIIIANINLEHLHQVQTDFPVLKDRKPKIYEQGLQIV